MMEGPATSTCTRSGKSHSRNGTKVPEVPGYK